MLKPLDIIVLTESVRLKDKNSLSQSYSLSSINSITNQKKQSSSAASFTDSESLLLLINWTSDKTALNNLMLTLSVNFDLFLSIDLRLLNVFNLQSILLS